MWPGLYRKLIEFLRNVVWHMKVSTCLIGHVIKSVKVFLTETSTSPAPPPHKISCLLSCGFCKHSPDHEPWQAITIYVYIATKVWSLSFWENSLAFDHGPETWYRQRGAEFVLIMLMGAFISLRSMPISHKSDHVIAMYHWIRKQSFITRGDGQEEWGCIFVVLFLLERSSCLHFFLVLN